MLVVNNTMVVDKQNSYQSITLNLTPRVRHDKMNGEEYWVVPMVMLTEGVHAGSNGPLYYSPDELGKTPVVWNHKPIVVYHPEANGQAISACDVDVINTRGVGMIMGTKFEKGKLKGEAWLRPNRLKEVDERIYKAIENGTPMEVSTGLFTDNDDVEGEWKGEKYKAIARNFRPDHLAILPDQKGACSLEDGAGLLRNAANGNMDLARAVFNHALELARNEMSDSERAQQLSSLLAKGVGIQSAWPVDVYDSYFIFSEGGKYYKQEYTTDGDELKLRGTKQEVFRTTQYKTVDGTVVGNYDPSQERDEDGKWTDEGGGSSGGAKGKDPNDIPRAEREKIHDEMMKGVYDATVFSSKPAKEDSFEKEVGGVKKELEGYVKFREEAMAKDLKELKNLPDDAAHKKERQELGRWIKQRQQELDAAKSTLKNPKQVKAMAKQRFLLSKIDRMKTEYKKIAATPENKEQRRRLKAQIDEMGREREELNSILSNKVDVFAKNVCKENIKMDKATLVNGLITNADSPWMEDDREFLMSKDEKFLEALVANPTQNKATCPKDLSEAEQAKWDKMSEEERVTWMESRKEKTTENAEVQSAEQFIATAPPVYREVLTEGLAAHNAAKAELIKTITANKANIIPVEHLQAKSLSELRGIAALAGAVKTTQPTANYAGLADGGANEEKCEPLVAPVMNFDPAK